MVVNAASARGTGQIPDKEDQMYVVGRDDLYLVPTAEVPVTNLHRDEILEASELPIRYAAYTPCFRREAGAAGKDTRGILRVHQFDKVEMVLFEKPEDSEAALEWMTAARGGAAPAARPAVPGRADEHAASSASSSARSTTSRSGRRASSAGSRSARAPTSATTRPAGWRSATGPTPGAKPELVHTLNGSGLALPRIVAALLEVYQQPDGSVAIPEVLRPYVGAARIGEPSAA